MINFYNIAALMCFVCTLVVDKEIDRDISPLRAMYEAPFVRSWALGVIFWVIQYAAA